MKRRSLTKHKPRKRVVKQEKISFDERFFIAAGLFSGAFRETDARFLGARL